MKKDKRKLLSNEEGVLSTILIKLSVKFSGFGSSHTLLLHSIIPSLLILSIGVSILFCETVRVEVTVGVMEIRILVKEGVSVGVIV